MSCAATMEVALRQRLDGVAGVAISEGEQTTEVIFAPGDHAFSLAGFRAALRQADVEVVSVHVEACGVIQEADGSRELRAGQITLQLTGAEDAAAGTGVCVSGQLEEEADRMRIAVDRFQPAPDLRAGA